MASLGIIPAIIGVVYNIRNIEQTLLRLVARSFSDIFGRKRLIFLGLVFIIVVPFIYSISFDIWLPIIALVISGIGISIFFPPSEAYASSLYLQPRSEQLWGGTT